MRAVYRHAALVLPIAGLAALWGWSDYQSRQGTDWLVPVEGYDPRDLLRGHYVEFTYDWPGIDNEELYVDRGFCIIGTPPRVEALGRLDPGRACAHPVRVDFSGVYGESSLVRGRLYIPQTQADELQDQLSDPALRGYVLVRQRADGHITPRELRFETHAEGAQPTESP